MKLQTLKINTFNKQKQNKRDSSFTFTITNVYLHYKLLCFRLCLRLKNWTKKIEISCKYLVTSFLIRSINTKSKHIQKNVRIEHTFQLARFRSPLSTAADDNDCTE